MIKIIITIMIMNVGSIWLTALNARQIKVSSAVAYDFNQPILSLAPTRKNKIFLVHPSNNFQFPSLE